MKVLHYSTTDYGGAYRAAERINCSLKKIGFDSFITVRTKKNENSPVSEYINNPFKKLLSKAMNVFNLILSPSEIASDFFGSDVTNSTNYNESDVIVLHWVNSFISYRTVKKITKTNKIILWVIHDMWPFTGGCHYTRGCNNYMNRCEYCPFDSLNLKLGIPTLNLIIKRRVFQNSSIKFIAVSDWINECACNSAILSGCSITTIHNPIDTELFKPIDTQNIPRKYDLSGKKIILFGADKATKNTTKGFNYLIEALKQLDGSIFTAICFGNAPYESQIQLPNIEINYIGSISNDKDLVYLYNISDVMVVPSLQEAFGYTCCEALACGTPVVAFNTGGLSEQIHHKENGYLARTEDVSDLTAGIYYCIDNASSLSTHAREYVLRNNSLDIIGKKYSDLIFN